MPPQAHGVKVISIGMFTPGNDAVVWRGPMLHRALQQFLADVYWGDLDVLLLDLPPGTGDIAISTAQLVPERRAARGDHAADRPRPRWPSAPGRSRCRPASGSRAWSRTCRGWSCPTAPAWRCSASGGGQAVADSLSTALGAPVPLLGQVPLETRLRECGDGGTPIVLAEPDSPGRHRAAPHRRTARRAGPRPGRAQPEHHPGLTPCARERVPVMSLVSAHDLGGMWTPPTSTPSNCSPPTAPARCRRSRRPARCWPASPGWTRGSTRSASSTRPRR